MKLLDLSKDGEEKTNLARREIPIFCSSDIGIDAIGYVKFLICCEPLANTTITLLDL